MRDTKYRWLTDPTVPSMDDPEELLRSAQEFVSTGALTTAAQLLDHGYGIRPDFVNLTRLRAEVLDRLAIVEHGLRFRYIPAGRFLMGCDEGEPDERPRHTVWLSAYYLAETPTSWTAYCRCMDFALPPRGCPKEFLTTPHKGFDDKRFQLYERNKLRIRYCKAQVLRAPDSDSEDPNGEGDSGSDLDLLEMLEFEDEGLALAQTYAQRPMVAVGWQEAEELAVRLNRNGARYALPSEAQWEKAARGGIIGARYAWGNEPATSERCDCDHFYSFSIRPLRAFPSNGYGLYGMCGGVWEWTGDFYDRDAYRRPVVKDPVGPKQGEERVLRGGSWADCASAATVSFRMSRSSSSWREGTWGESVSPTIGFRLCRAVD